jgi:hypothetical protein
MSDVIDSLKIQSMIYIIRGHKVMLDSDLAQLYGVEVKRLNEQVKRNIERFPKDFMFQCDINDLNDLRSQIATANSISNWNYMNRSIPFVFTESGVAMLSSVLNSKQAIAVNIEIIRIFIKLRSFLLIENNLNSKIDKLSQETNKVFKSVFEKLDQHEKMLSPKVNQGRKKIGLK